MENPLQEQRMDQNLKDFYFFSHFLNRKVYGSSEQKVGRISDLVAERTEPYPMIMGLMVKGKVKTFYLPWEKILRVEPEIRLSENTLGSMVPAPPGKDHILLREAVMDKQ